METSLGIDGGPRVSQTEVYGALNETDRLVSCFSEELRRACHIGQARLEERLEPGVIMICTVQILLQQDVPSDSSV